MTLCVAMLIAAEFLPVSLLTPIAADLAATAGMAGQAISISGLFALVTSLLIASFARRYDRRHVWSGLTGLMLIALILISMAKDFSMLTFCGAFTVFTYFRPFLETRTLVNPSEFSLLTLVMGVAGFAGTYGAGALATKRLPMPLGGIPFALGIVTLGLLTFGNNTILGAALSFIWGALDSAVPVSWASWMTKTVKDEPESAGGLLVAAIQLAIMSGATFGSALLDQISIEATLIGGTVLLALASLVIGSGSRVFYENVDTQSLVQRKIPYIESK